MTNLLRNLPSIPDALAPQFPPIGNADSKCPSCSAELTKRPARKTPCPACGAPILVRTRPDSRIRVLVTEEQADVIAFQWSINDFFRNLSTERSNRYNAVRRKMVDLGTPEPRHVEVLREVYSSEARRHAQDGNWGQHLLLLGWLAHLRIEEGCVDDALPELLAVAALELNAPTDYGRMQGCANPGREFLFLTETGWVMPRTKASILDACQALGLTFDHLRPRFDAAYSHLLQSFPLPLDVEKAWQNFRREMRKPL